MPMISAVVNDNFCNNIMFSIVFIYLFICVHFHLILSVSIIILNMYLKSVFFCTDISIIILIIL